MTTSQPNDPGSSRGGGANQPTFWRPDTDGGAAIHRTIRKPELRRIIPLADTTIYEMEQRGEFPRRFNLTPRCVVWSLAEVEAWIGERRIASDANVLRRAPGPDVHLRKNRPVR